MMCYRVFMASSVATFFLGIFVFLLGMHLLPGLAPAILPVVALVTGVTGLVTAVSGLMLVWGHGVRA